MNNLSKNKIIYGTIAIFVIIVIIGFSSCSCNRESFKEAVSLGQSDLKNGNYEGSIYHLKRAADLDSGNATIWVNLGVAYFKSKDYSSAANSFEKAVLIDPSEQNLESLAVSRLKQNSYDEAINAYNRAITEYGRKPDLIAGLAACHVLKGNRNYAFSLLSEALNDEPNNPVALYNIAVLYAQNNDVVEAAKNFVKFFDFADSVKYADQIAQARVHFAEITKKYPMNNKEEAYKNYTIAVDNYRKKNFKAAFKAALEASMLDYTEPTYVALLAEISKKVNKPDNVARLKQRLENGFPEFTSAMKN